ncbi:MAG: riboflavin synthase [Vicinamibacterales bacterium]
MFTGIVESVGRIAEVKPMAGGYRVRIETSLAAETRPGDSLAVAGVCLTALVAADGDVHADIGPETARITTLGSLTRGQRVNLERPLQSGARLGGHFVLGHVDGIGVVDEVRQEGESRWITVEFPPALAALFIRKGSVTVDGVSLTVAGLDGRRFDIQVIPFTLAHTTLADLKRGDRVNLECDVLGKYVQRALETSGLPQAQKR